MQLYFAITNFDTSYTMNHFAASEEYLDRYDAVEDEIQSEEDALTGLDPENDEYVAALAHISELQDELDHIHTGWEMLHEDFFLLTFLKSPCFYDILCMSTSHIRISLNRSRKNYRTGGLS